MRLTRLILAAAVLALPACSGLPDIPLPFPSPDPGTGYDCNAGEAQNCGQFFRPGEWISGRVIVTLKGQLSPQGGIAPLGVTQVEALVGTLSTIEGVSNVRALSNVGLLAVNVENLASVVRLVGNPAVCNVSAVQTYTVPEPKESGPDSEALSWGLDAVDARSGLDGQYNPRGTGKGVHAVIIDTGVSPHIDFGDRLSPECFSAPGLSSCQDGHGHGTHVAGTIGGTTWGIAKEVTLHSSRVLNDQGSGTTEQVIAGVDWVVGLKQSHPDWDIVGNMSLGGSPDPPLDESLCRAYAAGVPIAIAAGNDYGASACSASPARTLQQITVMASNNGDSLASFSNAGSCSDIIAPGENIRSAKPGGGGWQDMSGTSMASPHVAGALAICLDLNPGIGVQCIDKVLEWATHDRIKNVPSDAPNLFEYVGPED